MNYDQLCLNIINFKSDNNKNLDKIFNIITMLKYPNEL